MSLRCGNPFAVQVQIGPFNSRLIDIFVSPSINERVSESTPEAVTPSTVMVVMWVGEIGEIVADGRTGTRDERENGYPMKGVILLYVDDPVQRVKRHSAAKRMIENHFSLNGTPRHNLRVDYRPMLWSDLSTTEMAA